MRKLFTFLLLAIITSCTRIDAGYEGIKVKQYGSSKGVQEISLVTGRVWYNPMTESVYEFPVFVQTVDYEPFTVNARDGSVFSVDPTITFSIITGKSPEIFKKYKKDIEEIEKTTLYNYIRDAFRVQFNKFTTDSMISNRENFELAVQTQLDAELSKEGFHLEMLTSGIQYPETITHAIDAKANQLRQQSLTPLLIQQQFIEKWDGKTPLYGNSPVMFKNI